MGWMRDGEQEMGWMRDGAKGESGVVGEHHEEREHGCEMEQRERVEERADGEERGGEDEEGERGEMRLEMRRLWRRRDGETDSRLGERERERDRGGRRDERRAMRRTTGVEWGGRCTWACGGLEGWSGDGGLEAQMYKGAGATHTRKYLVLSTPGSTSGAGRERREGACAHARSHEVVEQIENIRLSLSGS
jgi:hypothetical protein